MRPTTMMFRNLMAMDVEESIRANPIDGVVLLCGCDKTTPAQIMGAAPRELPGDRRAPAVQCSRACGAISEIGSGTDVWRFARSTAPAAWAKSNWSRSRRCIRARRGTAW